MPVQLLPASAAAYAPRASVNVVLGSKVEPWLTQTLKRVNRVKRPLNSVQQHQRCLTDILSSASAIWTLASLMLAKAPEPELDRDPDPLVQAIRNYDLVHIEAYVVHVDMVLRSEVAFKLTTDTIDALVRYHKAVHCANARAGTYDWAEKQQRCKKLHEDFVQAVNRFVFRTHVSALEGLEEEGAGEMLCGRSEEVKNSIMGLLKPLIPPPPPRPRVVDVVRPPPTLLPSSAMWSTQPTPVEAWRILPSNSGGGHGHAGSHAHAHAHAHDHGHGHGQGGGHGHGGGHVHGHGGGAGGDSGSGSNMAAITSASATSSLWAGMGLNDIAISSHPPPPPLLAPSFHTPYSSGGGGGGGGGSSGGSGGGFFYGAMPVSAPMSAAALALPSLLSPPCGIGMGMGVGVGVNVGASSFGWDHRFQDYAAATI